MSESADIRRNRCPECKREFTYDPANTPKWHPFCCERCQWVDLSRWLNGEFKVSREIKEADLDQND